MDVTFVLCLRVIVFSFPGAGLRTPLAVPGPYPGAFGMLPHAGGMNGELASAAGAAAYAAGLHNMSPQMSAAAAAAAVAAYGRSPMVSYTVKTLCLKAFFSFLLYRVRATRCKLWRFHRCISVCATI